MLNEGGVIGGSFLSGFNVCVGVDINKGDGARAIPTAASEDSFGFFELSSPPSQCVIERLFKKDEIRFRFSIREGTYHA